VPGKVKYFPRNTSLKVPHIGWNELAWTRQDGLAQGARQGEQTYFVHSLVTECEDPADVAATTEHGIRFASAVMRENVWGTQFHPEKSGDVGLRILRNFLTW
jgi:glutamine amidotransferase